MREAVSIRAMQQFLDHRCNLASMKHFLTTVSHIFRDLLGLLWPEVTCECFGFLAGIGLTLDGSFTGKTVSAAQRRGVSCYNVRCIQ